MSRIAQILKDQFVVIRDIRARKTTRKETTMNEQKRIWNPVDLIWLVLGAVLYAFVGWRWSMPLAAWLAPLFLIRFFRNQDKWYKALVALPLIALAGFANKTGAWDLDLITEIALCLLLPVPLGIALYADRFLARRNKGLLGALAFPAFYTALDYAFALNPQLGVITSIANTQFGLLPLAQLASVTGIWGVTFMVSWFASTVNTLWDNGFQLSRAVRPVAAFVACLGLVLMLSEIRLALWRPEAPTVRVASITVAHVRDYWSDIIDLGTPRDKAHQYEQELADLNEQLFATSAQAAQSGAKIIFWSEGDGVLYEEQEAGFMQRAQAFAQAHQVYFAPALLVLHYGQTSSDNKIVMIDPAGKVSYSYTKTISWYATDSDGIIDVVDTPYGRLASAICFDMDSPGFIRQAAQKNVDIMIVPAFDSQGIRPYHTYVGLFRGIEDGFSTVRQVNAGTSMAVDYEGNMLAYQDFFRTPERVMFSDVPTRGVRTLYGLLGDWFAYLCILASVAMLAAALRPTR
jgi:apolipoprotein N-acyltransferase